jgi:hypothetical protein
MKKSAFEVLETLERIESKMDIILAKFYSLEDRKKFTPVTVSSVSEPPTGAHSIHTFGDSKFHDELVRRVEELKAIKHMGESHGFEPGETSSGGTSSPLTPLSEGGKASLEDGVSPL